MALTERQQQIQDLVRDGKSAKEIASALGISENAVYQHRRRMRDGGSGGSTGSRRTTQRASTGRQSAATGNGDTPAPAAPTKAVSPERALRDEKADLERQVKDYDADVAAAEKALEQAKAKRDTGVAKLTDRLTAVSFALDALSGNVTRPDAPATDTPDQPADAAQTPQAAPAQAENGTEAAKPADTPKQTGAKRSGGGKGAKAAGSNGKPADTAKADEAKPADDGAQAEADAAQAAAEQPDAEVAAA